MPQVFGAPWILPIAQRPIRDGWVAVERGRIVDVGTHPPVEHVQQFADVAILPGLVNAHVHLELSWMADHVRPAASMPVWAARLMALRRTVGSDPTAPIVAAIRDVRASGTALIGDITNSFAGYDALVDSDLAAAIFRELLGFSAPDPERLVADTLAQIEDLTPIAWLRPSIVPHAPYSVSPALFHAIAKASAGRPVSVHLGESADEVQFLRDGTGGWRDLLEDLHVWGDGWRPPGCRPVEYLDRVGLVNERLIAVHCVQLIDQELQALAAARATVVTCPRSNEWTGAGSPPIDRFYASGVRVAIGTDSLASVPDLQMFKEIAAVRALAPRVPAFRVLESATRNGAEALGFAEEFGTIEAGKCADLIAVTVPQGVDDVEEYLVSGQVKPEHIRWVQADTLDAEL